MEDITTVFLKIFKQFYLTETKDGKPLTEKTIGKCEQKYIESIMIKPDNIFYLIFKFDGNQLDNVYTFRHPLEQVSFDIKSIAEIDVSEFTYICEHNPRRSLDDLLHNGYFIEYDDKKEIGHKNPYNKNHQINNWIPSRERLKKVFDKKFKQI